ncbi:CocE/NonD family hydrolase [Phaeodactylibacter xiamenensis]|uniref:CocE/NonD family hydrolase n=1 Tax=Phaeodactylibacter xiamenensis TaxID=1524460 RepID=UPI003BAAB138
MKNIIALLITVVSVTTTFAQEFYFPKQTYSDSIALAAGIPALARQVYEAHESGAVAISLGNRFHLPLAAEQYGRATTLIDSLRLSFNEDFNRGIYFQFEAFAEAKQQSKSSGPFRQIFEAIFRAGYLDLNIASQEVVSANTRLSVEQFNEALKGIKAQYGSKDTLQLIEAIQLIRVYNFQQVYMQALDIMQQVVAEEDEKRFVVDSVMIETKDGSPLQAFVVRERASEGPLPTIFIFNIYADANRDVGRAKIYAAEGYACTVANTRGKGKSEALTEPFEHDGQDAYDVIDWISKQEWSNGEVGMVGGSYLGFAQWSATKRLHPALKTIMPQVAVGPGIDYPMNGNVFMSYMLRWIRYVTNNPTTDYPDFSNTNKWNTLFKTWYEQGTSFRSLDSLEGQPSDIFQRWLDHPSYDAFWQSMVPCKTDFSEIDIPVLTTTGYFDDDQMGAMYYYKQHHMHNPNATHYLVIGPYTHGGAQLYPNKEVGGYQVDSVATSLNFRNLSVEWFDYVLKKGEKPQILRDKVNYQVMGTNQWQHTSTLSGMATDTLTFYFNPTRSNDAYTLSPQPSAEYVEQEVDLADRSDATEFEFKVIRDSINTDLNTSISFISDPLEEPTIWSGSFIASLQVAINKKDFDIVIRAYEMMPDGRYFALFTESGFSALQRASYANDRTQRQLLTPDEKETVKINTSYITAKQMSKGSRLVITLGVNKSPYWQINYGTGKDVSEETIADAIEPLEIKWYGDSSIQIPILKAME